MTKKQVLKLDIAQIVYIFTSLSLLYRALSYFMVIYMIFDHIGITFHWLIGILAILVFYIMFKIAKTATLV